MTVAVQEGLRTGACDLQRSLQRAIQPIVIAGQSFRQHRRCPPGSHPRTFRHADQPVEIGEMRLRRLQPPMPRQFGVVPIAGVPSCHRAQQISHLGMVDRRLRRAEQRAFGAADVLEQRDRPARSIVDGAVVAAGRFDVQGRP
ncbi:hypothetical protein [Nocardia sp. CY41]|uniref:hypothetical protein n=1 Tax=Nocardia sp. CY41 TaxID=2608686 RepID=UPI0019155931|nr:hypothetical protein [Nocardia sp. CY41]